MTTVTQHITNVQILKQYKKVNEIANREILNHLVQKIVKIENDNNILKKEISNLKRYLKEKNSIYRKEETENHKEFLETSIEEKNMFCWYHTKFKGNALKCQYPCSFKQKTYAQKPRIRTFYNSKIKKNHKKDYVEEITTPIQKGKLFHKNIDCNKTKTEYFEIKQATQTQNNHIHDKNYQKNFFKLAEKETQTTKKQSQTKTFDKEIQTQSILIRKFRDNYSQTKDTEHNQLKPTLREMYTNTSINKNESIQANTITINKTIQKSTDVFAEEQSNINSSRESEESIMKPKQDLEKNEQHIEINTISNNKNKNQVNNSNFEKEKILMNQNVFEFGKENKVEIYKDFLALVKNNVNDTFEGPYQIMDQLNKSFILNIEGKPMTINQKRITFCSTKPQNEINFDFLDRDIRNKIKPKFHPFFFQTS
jgi:hypothetical protein